MYVLKREGEYEQGKWQGDREREGISSILPADLGADMGLHLMILRSRPEPNKELDV